MSHTYDPLEVVVWGDFACFTRPELKAERVSYPIMTPSAARGTLEAIFWKPEFRWLIRQIHVLRPVSSSVIYQDAPTFYRHFSIMRNEIGKRASGEPISLADEGVRQQRHTLALRDVAYLIRADVKVRTGIAEDPAKYRDQFQRRVRRGQCFHRPYLGCREFAANFAAPTGDEEARRFHHTEPIDLGLMLFDIVYSTDGDSTPLFFPAKLQDGILHVKNELYERFGA